MNRVSVRAGLFGFVVGVGFATAGLATLGTLHAETAPRFDRGSFDATLNTVLSRYVDPVDEGRVFSVGLRAMLAELDPHSHFITAAERKRLTSRSRRGATGLSVALQVDRGGQARSLEVLAVAPDSPAERLGVRPGDHLLRIRDRSIDVLESQVEVELLLSGAIGEEVAVAILSPKEPQPRELSLVLDRARQQEFEHGLVELQDGRKLVHLVLRRFGADCGDRVKRALAARKQALGDELAGVVIDLRGNPGGEVDQALIIADLFLDHGVLTRTRGRGGRVLRVESAHPMSADVTTPLVILQDEHSASAAELLAVALQEHGRAKVVGERSYGKGTVQEVLGLPDGSVATFTTARYFSPNDHVIDKVGVTPDVQVDLPSSTPEAGQVDDGVRIAVQTLGVGSPATAVETRAVAPR